ncbi:MAG: glycine cleavage system aminomethyltransferase GcvT [Inquilinaceae bacterium]
MIESADTLRTTPLHGLHRALGGKMVPFAGYDMPVQYPSGILKEHLHTRAAAGLFDVSHMGQAILHADADAAGCLETLVPGDLEALRPGAMRYTLLLNDEGGILDDLMVTRPPGADDGRSLMLVVNAACKDADFAHIEAALEGRARLEREPDRALLALQGPQAAAVLARRVPAVADMPFMTAIAADYRGVPMRISRSGYTGEDGFELSMAAADAETVARDLLDQPEVLPIGLGARDSLRLEAGLCLYGHDIDATTTPVEASLAWTVGKRRRQDDGFPGAARILAQLADGAPRRRVGLRPDGRAPAREGTDIVDKSGRAIGRVTSGGFGPTVGAPIAMGYVDRASAAVGTEVDLLVRGKALPATVAKMPFVPPGYYRG